MCAVLVVGTEQAWQECVWNALSNFATCGSLPEQHNCLHTRPTAVCCRCSSIDRLLEAYINSNVSAASSHLHTRHTLMLCIHTFSSLSCLSYACKLSSSLLSSRVAAHAGWMTLTLLHPGFSLNYPVLPAFCSCCLSSVQFLFNGKSLSSIHTLIQNVLL